jgi:nuclear pore complex protein Nup133
MLSIGKLAHLAQLHETEAPADESILDGQLPFCAMSSVLFIYFTAFHDDLDFVSVQETLLQSFKPYLKPLRGRQSIDSQVDSIANAEASMISYMKALLHVRCHRKYTFV